MLFPICLIIIFVTFMFYISCYIVFLCYRIFCLFFFFFFFLSRRRHTRFDCDWSSDVCSSDLEPRLQGHAGPGRPRRPARLPAGHPLGRRPDWLLPDLLPGQPLRRTDLGNRDLRDLKSERSEERRVGKECRCWWSPLTQNNESV